MNALPSAVFLDRDGTIIEDVKYISRPEQVELIEGAAEAIARINAALVPVVVVTNQSGIGRGYFTMADYESVKERVEELLAERGARIDATYYCPHKPEDGCRCRKPDTEMFERAAADLGIDLRKALLYRRPVARRRAGAAIRRERRADTRRKERRRRDRTRSPRCPRRGLARNGARLVPVHELIGAIP